MSHIDEFNEQMGIRLNKIKEYQEMGINSYINNVKPKHRNEALIQEYEGFSKEELETKEVLVTLAGRIMTKRGQGKAGFANMKDATGQLQIYVAKNNISEEEFFIWNKIDIGDIVYVEGELFKTKVGELSVRVHQFKLVTKSLRPLPEKYHGLSDVEERYRRRYVDLIVNEKSKDTLTKKSIIVNELRQALTEEGYLEVETPILQTIAGGAMAKPFITHHNALDIEMYLRIATELHLKRLIVGGYEKVFEIGRLFRNEGLSIKHNPEFTTVELYAAYNTMDDMMDITERVIKRINKKVNGTDVITYSGVEYDLANFKKVHMVDLIKEITGVDFWPVTEVETAKNLAKEHNVEIDSHHYEVGHIINEFFEQKCEDVLVQPTFVYGHPRAVSPLARLNEEDSRFTDRFELFIGGREYANAFSELNDPLDQLSRFQEQVKERDLGNDEASEIDMDYIEALEYAMPPTGGLGIGIDRLAMLLTDAPSIRDIIFFPTMKRL